MMLKVPLVDSLDSRNDHLQLALKLGETAMADDRGQQVVESVGLTRQGSHEPVVLRIRA